MTSRREVLNPLYKVLNPLDMLRLAAGILRSLRIYYGGKTRRKAMEDMYRRFVKPGDLAFDLGAHVGDRLVAFHRLGCRVVAVEPQPCLACLLRLLHGRRRGVTIVRAAVGARKGVLSFNLNLSNPAVATGSSSFIAAAHGEDGWREQAWTRRIDVPLITLDSLIAEHGPPAFMKIDVEGFEAEVLAGLSKAVPALSFEFTTLQRDVALSAIARCSALGPYRFNAALGESQELEFPDFMDARSISSWLSDLSRNANSGDIYAMLDKGTPGSKAR